MSRRPRLAVFSPLPPSPSGVADYTNRLLPTLVRDWEVVVLIPDGEPAPVGLRAECEVLHEASWRWLHEARGVDRLLVCIGNSRFHLAAPDVLGAHGGVVLAHDARMTALQCLRAAASPDPHLLSGLVEDRHGPEVGRLVREVEERSSIAASFPAVRRQLDQLGCLLLEATVRGAERVLVHSATAARLARLDLHPAPLPVTVVPFGYPDRTPLAPHEGPPVVASLGMVEPEKDLLRLVQAMGAVRSRHPDAELHLIGAAGGGGYMDLLTAAAARGGVSGAVRTTGRLDDAAYADAVGRATVAVQLRAVVNGETSGAVADCLARGLPTVVTAVGAQAELPPSVVSHVDADIDPRLLGEHIADLLADPARRRALAGAGARWAVEHRFERAAGALSEILSSAAPPRG